ncbi:DUF5682 family protein [Micromonospora sp. NPDC049559]|uniref:DUF5682 family protein n=1 Tax=Micromonospora sp. NPDC049559 TaxID=3155923 RepID=UPI00342FEBB7
MGAAEVTVIGVRHHSPACARLVADTVAALRPAYVLVEGPADMNDRLDELLLGHELPVAVFTSYRDGRRAHASWAPFCAYSPEWVALTVGRRHGAGLRFIDLPAWHPAFADRSNRYADAELRYAEAVERLCRAFAMDNVDTLWDHLFECDPDEGLAERLAVYFDLLRGESPAGDDDTAREAYMADWVDAARSHADGRPVLVVCGGFHRPALLRLAAGAPTGRDWPEVPAPPEDATAGSYLVPYSFRRLDAFDGYQSGLPSPDYYQRLWEHGPAGAAEGLLEAVVRRLRGRRQPVSTADLVAARTMADGLARIRGHRHPARADVLDGLVSALVGEALDGPLPWSRRGRLEAGTHPVVVEMVAALSGDRVGRLDPATPVPPLVHDVAAELERHGLAGDDPVRLDLTDRDQRETSRVLHRLRVLGVPGYARDSGPDASGADPRLREHWSPRPAGERLVAVIEAGAYGATLADAAAARLAERIDRAGPDVDRLAEVLFDAALCGVDRLSERVLAMLARSIAGVGDVGALGRVLAVVLGLWRHDRLLGTARAEALGVVLTASVPRLLWLVEGIRGGRAPADPERLAALAAARDTIVHAGPSLGIDGGPALAVMRRLAADPGVPPDLRGAASGFAWSLGDPVDPVRGVRGAAGPAVLGDWLAGLFALAREEVLAGEEVLAAEAPPAGSGRDGSRSGGSPAGSGRDAPGGSDPVGSSGGSPAVVDLLGVVDVVLGAMSEHDFLVALPALRQAFAFFPPRERDVIARRLLARRGLAGSGRSLLRVELDPMLVARARDLDAYVDALLLREGLMSTGERS